MKKKPLTIEQVLGRTFDRFVGKTRGHSKKKAEFIFHMTDWRSDLEELAKLYDAPEMVERKAAGQIVYGFIIHAVSHANAARRLIEPGFRDPFAPSEATPTKTSPNNSRKKSR
jgi:hypothetical protein